MSRKRARKTEGTVRRASARIQKLKDDEALRRSVEEVSNQPEENVVRRKSRVYAGKNPTPEVKPVAINLESSSSARIDIQYATNADIDPKYTVINNDNLSLPDEKTPHQMVRETLRIFNKTFLHFVKEEKKRCARVEADVVPSDVVPSDVEPTSDVVPSDVLPSSDVEPTSDVVPSDVLPSDVEPTLDVVPSDVVTSDVLQSKSLETEIVETSTIPVKDKKHSAMRPDLKSITKMAEKGEILQLNNGFGPIPGIDVGHQFFSRAEMVVLGFHSHWLNGIDYIGTSASKDYIGLTLPLTRSIVLSGQYEDDLDNCESIIYTGQGGNNLLGNKRQIKDQVMKRGNLGLKNCMEQGVPVRVVRGHDCKNSYVKKVYTYDGLYKVDMYWAEKGVSGFTVYKFKLSRLPGQPELTTSQVQFTRGHVPESVSTLRGLVCQDITGGQEDIPIPASNLVDDPPVPPTGFTYSRNIQVAKNVKVPKKAAGCDCVGGCTDPTKCSCAKLNGSDFPYVVHSHCGRLIEPKAVVFECGPNCGCDSSCVNRITQNRFVHRLEVFRTPKKGWGVRSWDSIPSGAPVCEYIGVLKKTEDLDASSDNNYIFDIDCLQTMQGLDGREKRLRDVTLSSEMEISDKDNNSDSQPEYCIDAGSVGNVSRFINHCCQPNLFVQCVLSCGHHDLKLARIVLFAADNIPPLQELTYDYGYALDSVVGPDGEIIKMACYCGADECRKRLL